MEIINQVPRTILGKTGLDVPVIPFGTQGFGNHFGSVSDQDAIELVKYAVSIGVNHFDCARCYGDSLRKFALALNEIPRNNVVITGRLCCHSAEKWGGYGKGTPDYSAERVIADVEDQLSLLGIDYFDGMLIHDPPDIDSTLSKNGTLEGLLRLKARGVVKNVGYGMRPHNFHMKVIATGDVDLILCFSDYNLIRQTAAEELLPAAKSAGIGVMNGFSILRGLLTGVNIKEAQKLGNYKVDVDADQAQIFWDWCDKNGVNLLQLALQFCLANDSIHAHPIGSLNREQLDTNVRAAKNPLDKAVIEKFTNHFKLSWG